MEFSAILSPPENLSSWEHFYNDVVNTLQNVYKVLTANQCSTNGYMCWVLKLKSVGVTLVRHAF